MAGLSSSDSWGLGAGEALLLPSKLMPTLGKPQMLPLVVPKSPSPRFCMGTRDSC